MQRYVNIAWVVTDCFWHKSGTDLRWQVEGQRGQRGREA